jgi:hypothetical protein
MVRRHPAAIPILVQVYFNSTLAYVLMRWFKVPHNVASPGALIGTSNFFELAVAVAITLFGPGSGGGAGHGCWRACRSAGDAFRLPHLQPIARLVSAWVKSDDRNPKEIRTPNAETCAEPVIRISGFGLLSELGFRTSEFKIN